MTLKREAIISLVFCSLIVIGAVFIGCQNQKGMRLSKEGIENHYYVDLQINDKGAIEYPDCRIYYLTNMRNDELIITAFLQKTSLRTRKPYNVKETIYIYLCDSNFIILDSRVIPHKVRRKEAIFSSSILEKAKYLAIGFYLYRKHREYKY